jgi:2-dehydro-3-deoxyphosphogluconate aldolase/(4S)-4-hydroxy-2-oxoglutarate aldolase
MSENFIKMIGEDKIYPILRCRDNNPKKMIEVAKALVDGGIRVLELNIENPAVYEAIQEVSQFAHVCAGGIITSTQADVALECGAKLFSSPIFQMNLIKISKNKRVPFIAGATTANEAYSAWKSRIPLTKLFPAHAMGGVQYIEDILRQMPFLNLMPMGNIKLNEVVTYIRAGAVAVGVGRDFYQGFETREITQRTRDILREIRNFNQWNNKK